MIETHLTHRGANWRIGTLNFIVDQLKLLDEPSFVTGSMLNHHFQHVLTQWLPKRDQSRWVLATVIDTQGSSYRKAGAMMLLDDQGQVLGLLSGGCLESDLVHQAQRCLETNRARIIEYDMSEEADMAWQLGLGCGGIIRIQLQPLTPHNHYHYLPELLAKLEARQSCCYQLCELEDGRENQLLESAEPGLGVFHLKPVPEIVIMGGGVDARAMVDQALLLGWRVTLTDPRVNYARPQYFPQGIRIVKEPYETLVDADWLEYIQLAIVMHHNITLDGRALSLLRDRQLAYIGLLGPQHRTQRVLETLERPSSFSVPLANPMGLRLGGELPESIALSTIAEAHAVIERKDGASISLGLDGFK